MARDDAVRTAGAGLLALLPVLALAPAEAAAGAICPAVDSVDLMAGQNTNAGDVKVCNVADTLRITYEPTGPWCVADTNLHVATDLDVIPRTRTGIPQPDQFAYGGPPEWDECTVTFEIPLEEIGAEGVEAEDTVVIAAQADLFVLEGTQQEGAWAAGTRFVERGNWATYFTYTVAEPPCGGEDSRCVFVTSTIHWGNLGGLAGADAICNARATEADLPGAGEYRAWLSNSQTTPSTRFDKDENTQYRLVNGDLVAEGWSDLTDGQLNNSINLTEAGTSCPGCYVWSNTATDGTRLGIRECSGWITSNPSFTGYLGSSSATDSNWTVGPDVLCSQAHRLYCFQQP